MSNVFFLIAINTLSIIKPSLNECEKFKVHLIVLYTVFYSENVIAFILKIHRIFLSDFLSCLMLVLGSRTTTNQTRAVPAALVNEGAESKRAPFCGALRCFCSCCEPVVTFEMLFKNKKMPNGLHSFNHNCRINAFPTNAGLERVGISVLQF